MMSKEQAIEWFRSIQNGDGVDRQKFPDNLKGEVAKHVWDDGEFTYGIEYGVLIALVEIFGIKREDLL